MGIRNCLIVLFLIGGTSRPAFGQYYPAGDFRSPLDSALYLSAPFGSLRDNHFHSGMDIRTYEQEGLPIYAIADGFVSRIKIQSGGYGKALYIDHPNGYTSVYGHLQQYAGDLASYVKRYQYSLRQYEFDHFPGRNTLSVRKGQLIGYTGNSGTSTGPHLHFEIRHTKSEEPINPLLFGLPVMDSLSPAIRKVRFYHLDGQSPRLVLTRDLIRSGLQVTDSGYLLRDTLLLPSGLMGVAVEAVDFLVNPEKEYSIYGLDLHIDDRAYFGFRLNRFHFNDTRCVNVHIDYETYRKEGVRYQKLFLDDGNRIPLYTLKRNKGKYLLKDGQVHMFRIKTLDFGGRSFTCYLPVKADTARNVLFTPSLCKGEWAYPGKGGSITSGALSVNVPGGALYDTSFLCIAELPKEKQMLSRVFAVGDPFIPLHKGISINIRPEEGVRPEWQKKLLLGYYTGSNAPRSAGGGYENGMVSAKTSQLGHFFVSIDTVPPMIRIPEGDKNSRMNDTSALRIRISDNFSGISSYQVQINGKWVLAEFDAKNDLLTYFFDEQTVFDKPSRVEVSVCDRKENCSTVSKELIFHR